MTRRDRRCPVTGADPVALVHDYLTQQGGAERVVLSLAEAFPGAPVFTSLYDPDGTFREFSELDVRTLALDRMALLRRHHRLALPVLAPAFSRLCVDADGDGVLVQRVGPRRVGDRSQGGLLPHPGTMALPDRPLPGRIGRLVGHALSMVTPPLRRWDRRAAASADRYLVNSSAVRQRVADLYGIDADVVPPAVDVDQAGPLEPVDGMAPGFVLCVSRLLAYKNVEAVVDAFRSLPGSPFGGGGYRSAA